MSVKVVSPGRPSGGVQLSGNTSGAPGTTSGLYRHGSRLTAVASDRLTAVHRRENTSASLPRRAIRSDEIHFSRPTVYVGVVNIALCWTYQRCGPPEWSQLSRKHVRYIGNDRGELLPVSYGHGTKLQEGSGLASDSASPSNKQVGDTLVSCRPIRSGDVDPVVFDG